MLEISPRPKEGQKGGGRKIEVAFTTQSPRTYFVLQNNAAGGVAACRHRGTTDLCNERTISFLTLSSLDMQMSAGAIFFISFPGTSTSNVTVMSPSSSSKSRGPSSMTHSNMLTLQPTFCFTFLNRRLMQHVCPRAQIARHVLERYAIRYVLETKQKPLQNKTKQKFKTTVPPSPFPFASPPRHFLAPQPSHPLPKLGANHVLHSPHLPLLKIPLVCFIVD